MQRAIVALAIILLLSGCVSNKVWYNPEKSSAEAERDLRECRYEAEKYSTGAGAGYSSPVGSGLDIAFKQLELIRQCMELRGYQRVRIQDLPPGSKVERLR